MAFDAEIGPDSAGPLLHAADAEVPSAIDRSATSNPAPSSVTLTVSRRRPSPGPAIRTVIDRAWEYLIELLTASRMIRIRW